MFWQIRGGVRCGTALAPGHLAESATLRDFPDSEIMHQKAGGHGGDAAQWPRSPSITGLLVKDRSIPSCELQYDHRPAEGDHARLSQWTYRDGKGLLILLDHRNS